MYIWRFIGPTYKYWLLLLSGTLEEKYLTHFRRVFSTLQSLRDGRHCNWNLTIWSVYMAIRLETTNLEVLAYIYYTSLRLVVSDMIGYIYRDTGTSHMLMNRTTINSRPSRDFLVWDWWWGQVRYHDLWCWNLQDHEVGHRTDPDTYLMSNRTCVKLFLQS